MAPVKVIAFLVLLSFSPVSNQSFLSMIQQEISLLNQLNQKELVNILEKAYQQLSNGNYQEYKKLMNEAQYIIANTTGSNNESKLLIYSYISKIYIFILESLNLINLSKKLNDSEALKLAQESYNKSIELLNNINNKESLAEADLEIENINKELNEAYNNIINVLTTNAMQKNGIILNLLYNLTEDQEYNEGKNIIDNSSVSKIRKGIEELKNVLDNMELRGEGYNVARELKKVISYLLEGDSEDASSLLLKVKYEINNIQDVKERNKLLHVYEILYYIIFD
jgi:hypothetical protein